MDSLYLTALVGNEALDWLDRPGNEAAWNNLYQHCPWRFPTLGPDYYRLWLKHYADEWLAVLVVATDDGDALRGVFPLAHGEGIVTGAGAHQAEYQGWLSSREDAGVFLHEALELIGRTCPSFHLRLRYLAPGIPSESVLEVCGRHPEAILTIHARPLMQLDQAAIEKALRKKGTRSKVNRLRRLGTLEFRRLTDIDEIIEKLDRIIALYDFRQGAANGSCPFLDDPRKRGFLLEWAEQAAHTDLHISCLTLNDEVVGAHIGVLGDNECQLAVLAYSPEYSRYSPGKLQVYETARMLAAGGAAYLDLTPGGDPWKERFATDHDSVLALEVYSTAGKARLIRLRQVAENMARKLLGWVGLSPAKLKALVRRRPVHGPNRAIVRGREAAPTGGRPLVDGGRIYRWKGVLPDTKPGIAAVHCNALGDLVCYHPGDHEPDRQTFLREAMDRLESGETVYTMVTDGRLVCSGWVLPEKTGDQQATIRGIRAESEYHDQLEALIRQMLCDLKDQDVDAVYLSIGPHEQQETGWIQNLGFAPASASPSQPPPQAGEA